MKSISLCALLALVCSCGPAITAPSAASSLTSTVAEPLPNMACTSGWFVLNQQLGVAGATGPTKIETVAPGETSLSASIHEGIVQASVEAVLRSRDIFTDEEREFAALETERLKADGIAIEVSHILITDALNDGETVAIKGRDVCEAE